MAWDRAGSAGSPAFRERHSPVEPAQGEPEIQLRAVEKVYRTRTARVRALDDVSLDVQESEFVCLLGPSGCGKSTLLKLVAGLEEPSGGSVKVGGVPVAGPVASLGIVFQQDLLLPWRSVLENILLQAEIRHLPRAEYEPVARTLLDMVGLQGFADMLPGELSGGMKQRAAICRALVHDPKTLLMDEPFGALDALTRDQMAVELQRIWLGNRKTILFVTHSIQEAVHLGDRVVVFSQRPGRIVENVEIDLPRPRRLAVRESPTFLQYVTHLRGVFESFGLLKEE